MTATIYTAPAAGTPEARIFFAPIDDGEYIAECEACGNSGLVAIQSCGDDAGAFCVPGLGCNDDPWAVRARNEMVAYETRS